MNIIIKYFIQILLLNALTQFEINSNIDLNSKGKNIQKILNKSDSIKLKHIRNIYYYFSVVTKNDSIMCLKITNICLLEKCNIEELYYYSNIIKKLNCEVKIPDNILESFSTFDFNTNIEYLYYYYYISKNINKENLNVMCPIVNKFIKNNIKVSLSNIKNLNNSYYYTYLSLDLSLECLKNNILNKEIFENFIVKLLDIGIINNKYFVFSDKLNTFITTSKLLIILFEFKEYLNNKDINNKIYSNKIFIINYYKDYIVQSIKEQYYYNKIINIFNNNFLILQFDNVLNIDNCGEKCDLELTLKSFKNDLISKKMDGLKIILNDNVKKYELKIVDNKIKIDNKLNIYKLELLGDNTIVILNNYLQLTKNIEIDKLYIQVNNQNHANNYQLVNHKSCKINLKANQNSFIHIKLHLKGYLSNNIYAKLFLKNNSIKNTTSDILLKQNEEEYYEGMLDLSDPDIILTYSGEYYIEININEPYFKSAIKVTCETIDVQFKYINKNHLVKKTEIQPKQNVNFVYENKQKYDKKIIPTIFLLLVIFSIIGFALLSRKVYSLSDLIIFNQKISTVIANMMYLFIIILLFCYIFYFGIEGKLIDYTLIFLGLILLSFIFGNKAYELLEIKQKIN